MKYLILVKHSLPEMIPTIPAKQWKLSNEGQLRCKRLAEKLASYSPEIVISSTEPKAIETAQNIARHMGTSFRTLEGLHEHDRAGVGFLHREQFESRVHELFEHPDELVMGAETANQARERFTNALLSIETEYPDQNIVVVAHGTVITLFVEEVTGLEPFPFWRKLDVPSFVVLSLPGHELITVMESVV